MSFVLPQVHIYSLGMTLFWGADHEVPQSQVSFIWFCSIPRSQTGLCLLHVNEHGGLSSWDTKEYELFSVLVYF